MRAKVIWSLLLPAGIALLMRHQEQATEHFHATFPFKQDTRTGIMVVPCRVDGRWSGTLGVDTGAGVSVITEQFAKRLHLQQIPATTANGEPLPLSFPTAYQPKMVRLRTLEVGAAITFADGTPVVWATRPIADLADEQLDGLLGMHAFEFTSVLFDFDSKTITVWHPSTLTPEELRSIGMQDSVSVPIMFKHNQAYVTLHAEHGKSEELCVDTGAVRTGISSELANGLKLRPKSERITQTLAGMIKMDISSVPSVQLGELQITDLAVEYPHLGEKAFPPHLGLDFLRRYRVLIDIPNGRMRLKPNMSSRSKQ